MVRRTVVQRHDPRLEHGQTLIVLVVLLATVGGIVFFTYFRPASATLQADRTTEAALAQAKDALIGYAATRPNLPGTLPCPDIDNDGLEDWDVSLTNCAAYIGRLPWMTLELPDLRDGAGERLWYALSPSFRSHAVVQPINSDTVGGLTITGTSPAANVPAIILAPGPIVGAQSRGAGNVNDPIQYLEGENNNGDFVYASALASAAFNDRLLPVTSDAIFGVVTMRVAKEVYNALEAYRAANGYYPDANNYGTAAPFACASGVKDGRLPLAIASGCPGLTDWAGELAAWYAANNWNLVTHYGVDNACTLSVTGISTAACTVVIVTGRAFTAQVHPCANAANCLEDAENANGDGVYVKPSRYPASNDRMAVKCSAASPCSAVP